MDIVNYDEPPAVRYTPSNNSRDVSVDEASVDSRRSQTRSVHFDQINPSFTNSKGTTMAKDGAPVTVQEHPIPAQKKKKLIRAPLSAYAMGPWPVISQPEDPSRRTVKEKHLNVYIGISILAIVLFFPTGIPAFIYALKTKEEFYKGIESSGTITETAIKLSRKCEKLLILTAICLLLISVLIFALVEKLVHDKPTTHRISNDPS